MIAQDLMGFNPSGLSFYEEFLWLLISDMELSLLRS